MSGVAALLEHPVVLKLGLALLHFLWQGAALAVVASALLLALRRARPAARYLALLVVLAAMAAAPVVTFLALPELPASMPLSAAIQTSAPAQPAAPATSLPPASPVGGSGSSAATPPSPDERPHPSLASRLTQARAWLEARLAWVAAGWVIGVFVLSLRLLLGWIGVARARRRGVEPAGEQWQAVLATLAERLRVSRPVRLLESAAAQVPTLIGWLRPVILLPASALSGLTPEQIEALIAHELAHVRRADYLVNVLQTVIETLLFYHPAVWWVSARVRAEREHCCDDLAVACCGDAVAYARALADLEHLRSAAPQPTLAASGGSLIVRVRRLVGASAPSCKRASWLAGAVTIVAVLALAIGLAFSTIASTTSMITPTPDWSNEPVVTIGMGAPGGPFGITPLYRSSAPVLTQGAEGSWDDRTAQAPSIIWNQDLGLYQMWYDGRSGRSDKAAVGYATSTDGFVWTKYKDNPVVQADARWPCVLYEPEDSAAPYKMWFNVGRGDAILYTTSTDGITWASPQTVMGRGPAGTYDDMDVAAPRVIKVKNEYWMYYTAGTSAITFPFGEWGHFVAIATSPDGVHWTKRRTVLSRGAPGEWDSTRVFNPAVIYADGRFEMWYVGGDTDPRSGRTMGPARNIGYASSADGIHWTKHPRNPVILGTDDPDAYDWGVTVPGVLKDEDGYHVWFTSLAKGGYRSSEVQVGYAEYGLYAWSDTPARGAPVAPPRYSYAAAWGMSDEERRGALVPTEAEAPKHIVLGAEYATFAAYAAAGDPDWTMVWDAVGDGQILYDSYQLATRAGRGLTILYGEWDRQFSGKRFVFGEVTTTGVGLTVQDDAYSEYGRKALHLNPNSSQRAAEPSPRGVLPEAPQALWPALGAARAYFSLLRAGNAAEAKKLAVFESAAAQREWENEVQEYAQRLKADGRKWLGDVRAIRTVSGPDSGEWAEAKVRWYHLKRQYWIAGPQQTYLMRTVEGKWRMAISSGATNQGVAWVPGDVTGPAAAPRADPVEGSSALALEDATLFPMPTNMGLLSGLEVDDKGRAYVVMTGLTVGKEGWLTYSNRLPRAVLVFDARGRPVGKIPAPEHNGAPIFIDGVASGGGALYLLEVRPHGKVWEIWRTPPGGFSGRAARLLISVRYARDRWMNQIAFCPPGTLLLLAGARPGVPGPSNTPLVRVDAATGKVTGMRAGSGRTALACAPNGDLFVLLAQADSIGTVHGASVVNYDASGKERGRFAISRKGVAWEFPSIAANESLLAVAETYNVPAPGDAGNRIAFFDHEGQYLGAITPSAVTRALGRPGGPQRFDLIALHGSRLYGADRADNRVWAVTVKIGGTSQPGGRR